MGLVRDEVKSEKGSAKVFLKLEIELLNSLIGVSREFLRSHHDLEQDRLGDAPVLNALYKRESRSGSQVLRASLQLDKIYSLKEGVTACNCNTYRIRGKSQERSIF